MFTVTEDVLAEQPVAVLVKVNVVLPTATAVTTPLFVTVATPELLLAQVPPEVGDNVVVEVPVPRVQIDELPVIFTVGPLIVRFRLATESHPAALLPASKL